MTLFEAIDAAFLGFDWETFFPKIGLSGGGAWAIGFARQYLCVRAFHRVFGRSGVVYAWWPNVGSVEIGSVWRRKCLRGASNPIRGGALGSWKNMRGLVARY